VNLKKEGNIRKIVQSGSESMQANRTRTSSGKGEGKMRKGGGCVAEES